MIGDRFCVTLSQNKASRNPHDFTPFLKDNRLDVDYTTFHSNISSDISTLTQKLIFRKLPAQFP